MPVTCKSLPCTDAADFPTGASGSNVSCRALQCVDPPDFPDTSGGLPNPFLSRAVFYTIGCTGGDIAYYTGLGAPWITLSGDNLQGSPGAYAGRTQEEADTKAQNALNAFAANAIAAGQLYCDLPPCVFDTVWLTFSFEVVGYVDGNVPNNIGGVPGFGAIIWDGTFKFQYTDGSGNPYWSGYNNLLPAQYHEMDGKTVCNAILNFECVAQLPTWYLTIYSDANAIIWRGALSNSNSPVGDYTNTLEGDDATPVTLTVDIIGGAPTVLGSLDLCS